MKHQFNIMDLIKFSYSPAMVLIRALELLNRD